MGETTRGVREGSAGGVFVFVIGVFFFFNSSFTRFQHPAARASYDFRPAPVGAARLPRDPAGCQPHSS